MLEIYQELVNVTAKGERAVLATVISSRGSAPRKVRAVNRRQYTLTFPGEEKKRP